MEQYASKCRVTWRLSRSARTGFGLDRVRFGPWDYLGFLTHSGEPVLAVTREYDSEAGVFAELASLLALQYCPRSNGPLSGQRGNSSRASAFKHRIPFAQVHGCLHHANESLERMIRDAAEISAWIQEREENAREATERMISTSGHMAAVCTSAAVVSVLITAFVTITLCMACARSQRHRYRKLK